MVNNNFSSFAMYYLGAGEKKVYLCVSRFFNLHHMFLYQPER